MNFFVKYYNVQNLGDDLFVLILANKFKRENFFLTGKRKYLSCFDSIKNVLCSEEYVSLKKIINKVVRRITHIDIELIKNTRYCDGLIIIGGSYFIEPSQKMRSYYNSRKSFVTFTPPVFVIGANFGPYKSSGFYNFYLKEFEKYNGICFREKYSYELFKGFPNVALAADVVFGIKDIYTPKVLTEKYVVVVVWNEIGSDIILSETARIIKELINKHYNIVLISFCEFEGDLKACKRICQILNEDIKIISYQGENLWDIIDCIANAVFVIGFRFHSIVLSIVYGVPVFPIAYSAKTINMLNEISFRGICTVISDLYNINADYIEKNLYVVDKVNDLIKRSSMQFDQLNDYISQKGKR